jgi:hypothetical protein
MPPCPASTFNKMLKESGTVKERQEGRGRALFKIYFKK